MFHYTYRKAESWIYPMAWWKTLDEEERSYYEEEYDVDFSKDKEVVRLSRFLEMENIKKEKEKANGN